jgi:MOSC domain-containing protein YiiM
VASVLSINVGKGRPIASKSGVSGIDKRPTEDSVEITAPGPGGSGLAGDTICDTKNHGGADQAVYAYANEDLEAWSVELGRPFGPGAFGENLTTLGLDVTGARIGERWQVGTDCILQVTCPRVPCRTFAVWLDDQGWIRTFTARAVPGAYLSVIQPGHVASGDPITIVHRPAHDVTIGLSFRALTAEPHRLPELLVAGADLTADVERRARRREPIGLD